MKFDWMDCGSGYYRCATDKPVPIKTLEWGGNMRNATVTDMGYIMRVAGLYRGHIYGTVHPDSPAKDFNTIEAAKRYVEEQALVGLALNKLTR
jgi:hypothetical protein